MKPFHKPSLNNCTFLPFLLVFFFMVFFFFLGREIPPCNNNHDLLNSELPGLTHVSPDWNGQIRDITPSSPLPPLLPSAPWCPRSAWCRSAGRTWTSFLFSWHSSHVWECWDEPSWTPRNFSCAENCEMTNEGGSNVNSKLLRHRF